jgi:hypothetical protein
MEFRERVETNFKLAGMVFDIDLNPSTRSGSADIDSAMKVISGLGLMGIDPHCFNLKHEGREVLSLPVPVGLFDDC